MAMENRYEEAVYKLTSKGITARFGQDTLPPTTYQNLLNLEVRQENALSLRFGRFPLTTNGIANLPLGGSVLQLGRLKGLGSNVWRYGQAGGNLYRIAGNAAGGWPLIANGLSVTDRESMVSYTPAFSATPYLFIADSNRLLKDNGSGIPTPWGLVWPPYPMTSTVDDFLYGFYYFGGGYTVVGGSSGGLLPYSQSGKIVKISGDNLVTISLPTVTGLVIGGKVNVFVQNVGNVVLTVQQLDVTNNLLFVANFGGVFTVQGVATTVTVSALRVNTVGSPGGTNTITPNVPFSVAQNWNPSTDGFQVPTVDLSAQVGDPTQLASIEIDVSTGDATFTNYFSYQIPAAQFSSAALNTLKIAESQFTAHGLADWTNVYNIRIIITSNFGAPHSTTVDLYSVTRDLGAQESILGGVDYDWRMTFFNADTGAESNPSNEQLAGSIYPPLGMFNLPVLLSWQPYSPPGATHRRIYRRGGTLATGWHMIAQIPTNAPPIYDVVSDQVASNGQLLGIDNFPPITSTLPVPVNTTLAAPAVAVPGGISSVTPVSMANISINQLVTIGQGATQETVTVFSIVGGTFNAYIEFNHATGEQVYSEAAYVQACNIAAIAFQRGWLAGDKNNPGRLYYSNVDAIEEFGVEAFLDLGNLTDPIMGMLYENGVLNIWTLSTAWMVYAISGSQPNQQQTDSNHGMFSQLGVIKGEGASFYLSDDGIYAWSGGRGTEASRFLQWIFREYNEDTAGPIPVMDLTQRPKVNFGYYQNEVFVSYWNVNAYRNRVIYSQRDNRWRNDDIQASCQLYETDTATLIYGDDFGMVYQDRVGDYDISGYSLGAPVYSPIVFDFLTEALDQGKPNNPKNYTEFVIDTNTNGQNVDIYLNFRSLGRIHLGTVNTATRQQVNFSLNGGEGYEDLWVAVELTGSNTAQQTIDIFEFRIKALVESEYRTSFDTYFTKYGTDGYKTAKQMYCEYTSSSPVTISVFEDGSPTASFSFTLPSSGGERAITWVRFPPTKFKIMRIVGTSADVNFQMYESSEVEVKPLCSGKGYTPQRLLM